MNNNDKGKNAVPPEVHHAFENEPDQVRQEMDRVWDLIGHAKSPGIVLSSDEKDRRWEELKSRVTEPSSEREETGEMRSARIFTLRKAWSYAAAAAIALLIGAYAFWAIPITVEAGFGETALATLPDGSTVQLNSGSQLSYARDFDGNPFTTAAARQVSLEGEAYFEVQPDVKPFVVQTFNAEVHVLGTEFNVRAHAGEIDRETTVVLASGRVRVNPLSHPENRVILDESGQATRVADASTSPDVPEAASLTQTLIWRENGFAANNETLRRVFFELERRFGVTIMVEQTDIFEDSLTMLLPRPGNIESILDAVCNARKLKYRASSRGYTVFRPEEAGM